MHVLGKVYRTSLSLLDRHIRVTLRKWVGLAHDTPDAMLYVEVDRRGLGIPEPSTAVRFSKRVRLDNHRSSCDPIVRAAARLAYMRRDVAYRSGPARLLRSNALSTPERRARVRPCNNQVCV